MAALLTCAEASLDSYLEMLIDAVRVSLNVLGVCGSETLCGPWCISTIVCSYRRATTLHSVIFTNPGAEETVSSAGSGTGRYVKTVGGKVAGK